MVVTAGLPFEPWGATTGIGSLPHTSVDDALDLVAATCPEVPYWPQLPRLAPAEEPVRQALGPLVGLVRPERGLLVSQVGEDELVDRLDAAATGGAPAPGVPGVPGLPAGLAAFVDAVAAGRFPRARAVKGQAYGPVTIAGLLRVDGRPALRRPRVVAALARHIGSQVRRQAETLAACGLPVLLVVDEPGLGAVGRLSPPPAGVAGALDLVCREARAGGALAGLHLCGEAAAHALATSPHGVVSIDVTGPAGAMRSLDDRALVAWGAVDAAGRAAVPLVVADVLGHLAMRTGDVGAGLRRSLLTPACGLALVGPAQARHTAERVQAVSAHLRRVVLEGLPVAHPAACPWRSGKG